MIGLNDLDVFDVLYVLDDLDDLDFLDVLDVLDVLNVLDVLDVLDLAKVCSEKISLIELHCHNVLNENKTERLRTTAMFWKAFSFSLIQI